jgi:hypothetical protein
MHRIAVCVDASFVAAAIGRHGGVGGILIRICINVRMATDGRRYGVIHIPHGDRWSPLRGIELPCVRMNIRASINVRMATDGRRYE